WIAANADQAVVRTARMGLPWFINPHAALPSIERQWQRYKQTLAEANQPMPSQRPIALELHIADSREQAVETARPFLMEKYNAYAEWGQDKALPGEESFRVSFDELAVVRQSPPRRCKARSGPRYCRHSRSRSRHRRSCPRHGR